MSNHRINELIIFCMLVLATVNGVYSQSQDITSFFKYLNGFNIIVIKSSIYSGGYVRNEVNVLYDLDGKTCMNTVVRCNDIKEEIDTTYFLNFAQMYEFLRFIDLVQRKETLWDSTQTEMYAVTRNKIEVTVTNFGGIAIINGERYEPEGEKVFNFLDESTYSLFKYTNKLR